MRSRKSLDHNFFFLGAVRDNNVLAFDTTYMPAKLKEHEISLHFILLGGYKWGGENLSNTISYVKKQKNKRLIIPII